MVKHMTTTLPAIAILLLSHFDQADGHGLLVTPNPRDGTRNAGNNKGRNVGPCGKSNGLQTQGNPVVTYKAGDTVNVAWQTDIPHGGTCQIAITEENTGVPQNVGNDGILDGNANGVYLLGGPNGFPCCKNRGAESMDVTIPADASCDACVLQWFWEGDSNYYDCSDISIQANAPPQPPSTGGTNGMGSGLLRGCDTFAQGCNGHGDCVNDQCVCSAGYFGVDCALYMHDDGSSGFTMTVDTTADFIEEEPLMNTIAATLDIDVSRLAIEATWEETGGMFGRRLQTADGAAAAGGMMNIYMKIFPGTGGTAEPQMLSPGAATLLLLEYHEIGKLKDTMQNPITGVGYTAINIEPGPCEGCSSLAQMVGAGALLLGGVFFVFYAIMVYRKRTVCIHKSKSNFQQPQNANTGPSYTPSKFQAAPAFGGAAPGLPRQGMAPAAMPQMPPTAASPWIQCDDGKGSKYWYNNQTKASSWTKPPGA